MSKRKFLLLDSSVKVTDSKEKARYILVETWCKRMSEVMEKIHLTLEKFGISVIHIAEPSGKRSFIFSAIILFGLNDMPKPKWINASDVISSELKKYMVCDSTRCWFK